MIADTSARSAASVRVLIVDDHAIVREGVADQDEAPPEGE